MKRFNIKVVDIDSRNFYYTIRRNKKYNTITQQKRNLSLKEKEDVMMLDNNTSLDSIVNVMSSDNDLDENIIKNQLKEKITKVLSLLTPREERVIRMRFGIDLKTDHTLDEIGMHFNLTSDRIRQIEAKALRKLKHPSLSKELKVFLEVA